MSTDQTCTCCPPFNPEPWDGKELNWENKRFVKDHVTSFFHIPLNFGSVIKRNIRAIQAAGVCPEEMVALTDEKSPWGSDLYIEVTGEVPGAEMATLSGTFLSKVFEGPYRNIRNWMEEMRLHVLEQDKEIVKLYFFYTTCPKCAKKYGKNYVALLAQV